MYPYVYWGETMIEMTGVGIVLGFFVFVVSVYRYAAKHHLPFLPFFFSLPLFIIILYFLGKYMTFVLDYGIFFPASLQQFFFLLSPLDFEFHYVGLVSGFSLYVAFFLWKKVPKNQHKRRIDAFFSGLCLALIPMGIFFLLGDDFIGKKTTYTFLAVHSFADGSNLEKYGQVYPLGIFLSLVAFFSFVIKQFVDKRTDKRNGFVGFALLFFSISVVLLFQNYPRHGVMKLFSLTTDVKQYISWLVVFLCSFLHIAWNRKNLK